MDEAKKVLIVCETFPGYGGVERITILLANYLVQNGYGVSIISANRGDAASAAALDPAVACDNLLPDNGPGSNSRRNLDILESYIRSVGVDFVINQDLFSKVGARFSRGEKPVIISMLHTMPFSQMHNVLPVHASRGKTLRAKKLNHLKKRILTRIAPWRRIPRIVANYSFHFNNSNALAVLCEPYAARIAKAINKPQSDIAVMPNWLLPLQYRPNADKKKQVLYVGRLERSYKRVDRLLKIWHRVEMAHPDWQLLIVGDGPDRASLEMLSHKLGLQRVRFEGYSDNPAAYYDSASILCLTSQSEGLPLVVMEAQQSGVVPVVFSSSDGIRSLVTDRQSGLLVRPYSQRDFAAKLSSLMDSPQMLSLLSGSCVEWAERYSPQVGARRWVDLLERLDSSR